MIVPFKKELYAKLLEAFADLALTRSPRPRQPMEQVECEALIVEAGEVHSETIAVVVDLRGDHPGLAKHHDSAAPGGQGDRLRPSARSDRPQPRAGRNIFDRAGRQHQERHALPAQGSAR